MEVRIILPVNKINSPIHLGKIIPVSNDYPDMCVYCYDNTPKQKIQINYIFPGPHSNRMVCYGERSKVYSDLKLL